MGQLSLPGFPAAQATDRLLFAVYPSAPAAVTRIAPLAQRLRSEHGLRGKPIPTERLHATLHHLGDYAGLPPDLVVRARAAGAAVKTMRTFNVAFDRAASFRRMASNLPLVLLGGEGLDGLHEFQRTLGFALKRVGLRSWAGDKFTPHVTLLYDDQAVAERPTEEISWPVTDFALVRSHLGQTRHEVLAQWSLKH